MNDDLRQWTFHKEQLQTMRVIGYLEEYEPPQTILLTQDAGATLAVTVSRFHPEPGDTTGYKWSDSKGNPRVMEMPPYHICDMNKAIADIHEYGIRSRSQYIESLLSGANPIIWKTFHVAFEYISVSKVCYSPFQSQHEKMTNRSPRAHLFQMLSVSGWPLASQKSLGEFVVSKL